MVKCTMPKDHMAISRMMKVDQTMMLDNQKMVYGTMSTPTMTITEET